jgi:hypothetical protein
MHAEILSRWRARRTEWERLKAQVDGTRLCDEVLVDLGAVLSAERDAVVILREAVEKCGHSEGRLVECSPSTFPAEFRHAPMAVGRWTWI